MSDGLYAYVDTTAPARHKRSRSRSRSRSRTRPREGAERGALTLEAIEEKEDVTVTTSSIHSGSPSSDDDDERWAKFKKTASVIEDIELQMNKHGLPLFPQPVSDDAEDPLTWRWSVKIRILALISALSFHAQFTAFCIVSNARRQEGNEPTANQISSHQQYGISHNFSNFTYTQPRSLSEYISSYSVSHPSYGTLSHNHSVDDRSSSSAFWGLLVWRLPHHSHLTTR